MPGQGKANKLTYKPSATRLSGGKYAPTQWGQEVLVDLECPSGQLCQVRRPGITGLVKVGVLDSIDSLSGIVKTDHIDRVEKGKDPHVSAEEIRALASNKQGLLRALALADKVAVYCVVQPELQAVPLVRNPVTDEPELDDDMQPIEIPLEGRARTRIDKSTNQVQQLVYIDQVDLMDKMYILQFVVGGVTDLEEFRSGLAETVGDLESEPEVPLSPQ